MSPRGVCLLGALAVCAPTCQVSAQDAPRTVLLGSTAAGRFAAPGSTTDLPGLQRYFTDYAGNAVRRSQLDGSNVTTLVDGVSGPYGLAFDADAQRLVWTSSGDEVVQSAAPDGSGNTVLESSFEENYPLVTSEGELQVAYFVEGSELVKLSVDAQGNEERRVLLFLPAPESLHGLALGPLHDVLYLGDANGMMTRRLRLADASVAYLDYVETQPPPDPVPPPDPLPWPEFQAEGVR